MFIYYNNWLEDISAFSSEIIYMIFTKFSILYLLVTFPKNAGDSLLELMWTLDRRMRVKSYFRLSLKFIHKKDSAISSLFPVLAKKKKKKKNFKTQKYCMTRVRGMNRLLISHRPLSCCWCLYWKMLQSERREINIVCICNFATVLVVGVSVAQSVSAFGC